ncbi:hypothetical protein ACFWA5_02340 [Streptomyces mirabilis]|uniref:hypothetical protein n=1 Tax=Streptomyces mirabilis TaxID=68239 RepID=UPI00364AAB59
MGGHGGEHVRATTSLATGLHTRARHFARQGALHGVEITLAPWVAHQIFDVSMSDLADTVVDPVDVLGPGFRELTEALQAAPDWPARFALVDSALVRWTRSAHLGRSPAGELLGAWDLLVRSAGQEQAQSGEREGCQQAGRPPEPGRDLTRQAHTRRQEAEVAGAHDELPVPTTSHESSRSAIPIGEGRWESADRVLDLPVLGHPFGRPSRPHVGPVLVDVGERRLPTRKVAPRLGRRTVLVLSAEAGARNRPLGRGGGGGRGRRL